MVAVEQREGPLAQGIRAEDQAACACRVEVPRQLADPGGGEGAFAGRLGVACQELDGCAERAGAA
jgi:hypothetical protein